ncbi:RsbT co-antagonist protein rsbRD N-terminal domain-containing protein [Desulfonatronum thiosulfatophilum]|uniref:RsbT co-antagonist protein rsbRD N-terminal domain-containing protein n=1 Tax=Desulfonatronum thiosulfatophilum TaxID=617002 RepID=A0A1G6D6R6_9BACT|nr:RsbRD N-terminal domain-containing protein [Desulfonatronum thiosulfatophilum]SDB40833.1 RsbT co-antagonist protein rsbRD N-terminal domain-containing protein [Desulfonatronum thiosulfatophilum]
MELLCHEHFKDIAYSSHCSSHFHGITPFIHQPDSRHLLIFMTNDIITLLKDNKVMLVDRWTKLTLQTYPAESAHFYTREKDQFSNPVGHAMNKGLAEIFGAMLDGLDVQQVTSILDSMIRIRAVQGFVPSKSLAFLLFIKKIIREELGSEIKAKGMEEQLVVFEERIDGVLLVAFDIYSQCRSTLTELKSNEFINRHARLLKRANLMSEETRLS